MDTEHYKPLRSISTSRNGGVTNFGWCAGGEKCSKDEYKSYKLSVFKHWYVYHHKPKWFGEWPSDRYLGKFKWISARCDGKQWKNITQRAEWDGKVIVRENESLADRAARDIKLAVGYIVPYFYPELRDQRRKNWYHLQIRCSACKMTCAEVNRARRVRAFKLKWPAKTLQPHMDGYEAEEQAKREIGCKCA